MCSRVRESAFVGFEKQIVEESTEVWWFSMEVVESRYADEVDGRHYKVPGGPN